MQMQQSREEKRRMGCNGDYHKLIDGLISKDAKVRKPKYMGHILRCREIGWGTGVGHVGSIINANH